LALIRFFSTLISSASVRQLPQDIHINAAFPALTRLPETLLSCIQCSWFSTSQYPRMYFKNPSAEKSPLEI
jgi:hypothetical protein